MEISINVPMDIILGVNTVEGVRIRLESDCVDKLIEDLLNRLKGICIENLKVHPVVRAYRDFYWRIGIDPTKQRPSGEALVRRALKGKIPRINNVVDAGNLASIETLVPIGLYDLNKIEGNLTLRFAHDGELFKPIGGEEERLTENQIVLADEKKILHVFPYRDSRITMVREDTRNVLIVACGVPGIDKKIVSEACSKATKYILKLAGGKAGECVLVHKGL